MSKLSELEETFANNLIVHSLPHAIREFPFHAGRKWRFDFAWLDQKIAVEIEGGTHVNGRHNRHDGFEKDAEKYNTAVMDGWRVLRFTGAMVMDGRAINTTKELFERIGTMEMEF